MEQDSLEPRSILQSHTFSHTPRWRSQTWKSEPCSIPFLQSPRTGKITGIRSSGCLGRGTERTFWKDGNILYLNLVIDITSICFCQKSLMCTLEVTFLVCKYTSMTSFWKAITSQKIKLMFQIFFKKSCVRGTTYDYIYECMCKTHCLIYAWGIECSLARNKPVFYLYITYVLALCKKYD